MYLYIQDKILIVTDGRVVHVSDGEHIVSFIVGKADIDKALGVFKPEFREFVKKHLRQAGVLKEE